ncbi:MAG TPA: hypothetical protein VHA30_05130 [Patescibacteria group bacterium]|nr:hypothetical protein [Patescibacteria group bacterium]
MNETSGGHEINPEQNIRQPDQQRELRPLAERFDKKLVADIISFLGGGYAVTKFNEYSGGHYTLELSGSGAKRKIIRTDQPWPFMVDPDGQYRQAFEILLGDLAEPGRTQMSREKF